VLITRGIGNIVELGKASLLRFSIVADEFSWELHLVVTLLAKFSGASDLVVSIVGLAFDGHLKFWAKNFTKLVTKYCN